MLRSGLLSRVADELGLHAFDASVGALDLSLFMVAVFRPVDGGALVAFGEPFASADVTILRRLFGVLSHRDQG